MILILILHIDSNIDYLYIYYLLLKYILIYTGKIGDLSQPFFVKRLMCLFLNERISVTDIPIFRYVM